MVIHFPNDTERLAIYGQTGSGKTVKGLWHLEGRSWLKMPWTIFDFKCDPTIAKIPRLEEIDIRKPPPHHAGLYVVRPVPENDDAAVERYLWDVWRDERHGLFVDEAYMMGRTNKGWNAVLTQGRSKRIPVIGLSQRPSWLSPFFMSEANYHEVMHIENPADEERLRQWIRGFQPTARDYHSQYYDVARGRLTSFSPCPDEDEILNRFGDKMPRRMRLFSGLFNNAEPPDARRRRA